VKQLLPRETTEVSKAAGHASRVKFDAECDQESTLTKAKANRFHNPVGNRTGDGVAINFIRHKRERDILC
jgi:hypothetical protein